jgi:hypothetical protein
MGVYRNSIIYRKGKGGLERAILFKSQESSPKESGVLEISSILDILGALSEQTCFSITIHRFRDSLDFLEHRSGILKPQDLDKVH